MQSEYKQKCGLSFVQSAENKFFQKMMPENASKSAIGERVNSLLPNHLNSPEVIRCYSLKISYQHLKHFLSVVSYRSGRASLQDFDSKRHTLRKPRPTGRTMILPHSHSPSVIKPSQAMSAAAREPRRSRKANGVKCMTF